MLHGVVLLLPGEADALLLSGALDDARRGNGASAALLGARHHGEGLVHRLELASLEVGRLREHRARRLRVPEGHVPRARLREAPLALLGVRRRVDAALHHRATRRVVQHGDGGHQHAPRLQNARHLLRDARRPRPRVCASVAVRGIEHGVLERQVLQRRQNDGDGRPSPSVFFRFFVGAGTRDDAARDGVADRLTVVDGDDGFVFALRRELLGEHPRAAPEVKQRAVRLPETRVALATEHRARALVLGVDAREPGEEHAEHLAVQPVEEEARKRRLGQTHQAGGLLHERLADVVRGLGEFCVSDFTSKVPACRVFDVVGDVQVVVAHQAEKRQRRVHGRLRDGLGVVFVIPRGAIVLVGARARARPRTERGQRGEVRVLAPGRELGRGHRAGARRDRRLSAREARRDATRLDGNVNTAESASPRGGDVSEIAAARLEAREAREARDARGERRDGEDGHGG